MKPIRFRPRLVAKSVKPTTEFWDTAADVREPDSSSGSLQTDRSDRAGGRGVKVLSLGSDKLVVIRSKRRSRARNLVQGIGSAISIFPAPLQGSTFKIRRALSSSNELERDWFSLAADMNKAQVRLKSKFRQAPKR